MSIDLSMFLEIVGMLGSAAVQTWLIIKYLIDRQDKAVNKLRDERIAMIAELHNKVNKISDDHVKREEFNAHVEATKSDARSMLTMLTNLGVSINTRLDSVLLMMAARNKSDGNEG